MMLKDTLLGPSLSIPPHHPLSTKIIDPWTTRLLFSPIMVPIPSLIFIAWYVCLVECKDKSLECLGSEKDENKFSFWPCLSDSIVIFPILLMCLLRFALYKFELANVYRPEKVMIPNFTDLDVESVFFDSKPDCMPFM